MEDLKISVLMPTYNAEKYIGEAINSVLNQTYQNFELLICDDASTDSTKNIIEEFTDPRIIKFFNTKNKRKPETCNFLFSQCSGNLVTIHDADDISLPLRFEKIVNFFSKNDDVYMCGHDMQRMKEDGTLLPIYRRKAESYIDIIENMDCYNSDGDSSIFIRKEVVNKIGGLLRPYFQNNMDYDLALRMIEKYKSSNICEVLFLYRNNPKSISKDIVDYKKLATQDMTKFFAKERKARGRDSLMDGNHSLIKKKEEEFAKPFLQDRTLHLRQTAARFMYLNMFKQAIRYSWMAWAKEPLKLENLRTFQYCLRKSILRF